jgi:excisionase family DNA binding protein
MLEGTRLFPTLLTTSEVTKFLKISTKKLERDRWMEQGLPFVRVGRAVRYRAEDIEAFIASNRRVAK